MKKKVLIIEDDNFLGDVLQLKLEKEGYDIVLEKDGRRGLDLMKKIKPDIILLDIILPGMNGYEILEKKQKDKEISKIPIIVISNSGQPVEISHILDLGVKDYLVKASFDPEEVVAKVKAQLRDEEKSDSGEEGGLSGKKVMWVEDDKFLSDILEKKLSKEGCKLVHAGNGEDALDMVEKELPDIILLDILLPGMNGFEILEKIKSMPKVKSVPVIFLTNFGQETDIERGQKLGAAKFIVKAMTPLDEVMLEIKKVLQDRESSSKTKA